MLLRVQLIFRFCAIVLIQVLVLNKISIQWWTHPSGFPIFVPYLYPLFILVLPLRIPVWQVLLWGFVTGLTIDVFMNTAGMHAFATVLIAWLRTTALNMLLPKNRTEYTTHLPGVKSMGWIPFLAYSAILLFIHHAVFFYIETWSFANPGILLLKICASSITSLLLVMVYTLLFTQTQSSRTA